MKNFLGKLRAWMEDYIKSFYSDDSEVQKGILIKEEHTYCVTRLSGELAAHLKLSPRDAALAEIVGLLHDVGRFRQYSVYKTFNDAESEDHADLGLKVMAEEIPLLKELSEENLRLVKFAVANHNKKEIAPTDDSKELLFAKMIRDADKIDIYRVLEPYLFNVKAAPNFIKSSFDENVSPDFIDNFIAQKQADYRKIRTQGDRKLVRLMWVYDINFAWSLKKIMEKGYVERIAESLRPMDDKMKLGIKKLNDYIEEKCAQKDEITQRS